MGRRDGHPLVQALLLYIEVENTSFTYDDNTYTAAPDRGAARGRPGRRLPRPVGRAAVGGRKQADQDGEWVEHDLGQIPAGTTADLRVQGHPRLWTDQPIALRGDPGYDAQRGGPYCGMPTTDCWYQQYGANGTVLASGPVRPTPGPIDLLVQRQQPLGYDDWRVPTEADWSALTAGVSGGLDAWSRGHRLPQLASLSVTSHLNGVDSQVSVVPPMLVDLSGDGSSFGVETAPSATSDQLTVEKSTPTHELAGRVFLVRDMNRTGTHDPADPSQQVRTGGGGSTNQVSFSSPAACQNAPVYTVPDGVYVLYVTANGAPGGAGYENGQVVATNGGGGIVHTTLAVHPGERLRVQVGGPGGVAPGGKAEVGDRAPGGIGGGGAGGRSRAELAQPLGRSGGGGGFSGIANDDCSSWYVVAGGAGGGGAGATEKLAPQHLKGGRGGDGCPETGASCTPAAAAPSNGTTSEWSGKAGTPAPHAAGGESGIGGARAAGPSGMTGGNGADTPGDETSIGGGGGGGDVGYGVASPSEGASVTITPLGTPMVLQSADNGMALNISGDAAFEGAHLIQWPRSETWNERWQLNPTDTGFQIINPTSGMCLSVGDDLANSNPIVELATCEPDSFNQQWRVEWMDDGTLRITNDGRVLSITDSAAGSVVVTAPLGEGTGNSWANRWTAISPGWPAES